MFTVLGLDSQAVHILQQYLLGDGLLDALTDGWREERNKHKEKGHKKTKQKGVTTQSVFRVFFRRENK